MRHLLKRLLRQAGDKVDLAALVSFFDSNSPALPSPNYFESPNCGSQLSNFSPTDEQRKTVIQKFQPALATTYSGLLARGTNQVTKSHRVHLEDGIFEKTGIYSFSLPGRRFNIIQQLLEPSFSDLAASVREKRDNGQKLKFPDYVLNLAPNCDSFRETRNLLVEAGVFSLIDSREARPVELSQIALQFSDRERTIAEYGQIDSDGLPTHKGAYWHIDSSTAIRTKLLVYLDDVGPEQGPFMYIPGSHRLAGIEELAIRKANDLLRLSPKEFVSLPKHFQLHALFGEHLPLSDPSVNSFLSQEVRITGTAGTAILFDIDGVHRGGFVQTGVRRLIQCNFSVKY